MDLPDGSSLTLSYGYAVSSGIPKKEFVLPQFAAAIFESPSPVEIGWFHPRITTFANFLMMGTRLPVKPERCVMVRGRDSIAAFPDWAMPEAGYEEEGLLGLRFNYQQIAGSFDDAVRCWFDTARKYDKSMAVAVADVAGAAAGFDTARKYDKSMDLYFQTRLEGEAQSSDVQFLRLVRSLEAFYRARHPDEDKSIRGMLEDLPHDLPHDPLPEGRDRADFLSLVSDTRNCLSHGFLASKEQGLPEGADFVKMTARTELLVYGCYLNELEICGELKAAIMKERIRWVDGLEFL